MSYKNWIVYSICIVLFGSIFITPAQAQFGLESLQLLGFDDDNLLQNIPSLSDGNPAVGELFANLSLTSSPSNPEPFSDFELELIAPDQKYAGSLIKWFINGEEQTAARNKRKHTFTTGALGEVMNINVTLDTQAGLSDGITMRIIPTQIDIIVEGITTVPHFYKGRPLPSKQSQARAIAIIDTGTSLNRDTLSYQWEINNNPISGGGIRGLLGVNFEMPLDRESYLGVTISDASGVLGKKTIPIPVANPEILFYEDNPLRGTIQRVFNNAYTVLGNQVIVRGEPYYMSPFINNRDVLLEWKVGAQTIDNTGAEEVNVITLRGSGTNSRASVSLRLINTTTLGQSVSDAFQLQFGN